MGWSSLVPVLLLTLLLVSLGIDLQALKHSTDGTDDELCFAVPIIPADIHGIKNHVNPLRILMREHSLEGIYSGRPQVRVLNPASICRRAAESCE